jgi:predicted nucleotidyltransferase
MTLIPPDFKEFLRYLKDHEVRFLLIGGYAVNAHGYIRNTVDIDVWVASDPENRRRVVHAVREFGFASTRYDVLDGVEFEDCWSRRVQVVLDGVELPLISLPDLKTNKLASGRPKDLVDLNELEVDFQA